jgi:hypothetical protein
MQAHLLFLTRIQAVGRIIGVAKYGFKNNQRQEWSRFGAAFIPL